MMENVEERDDVPVQDSSAAVADAETASGERVQQLESEIAELKDRLLRLQADFDNLKRRTERERFEMMEFAGMETVKQLLPPLDDFQRALQMTPGDTAGPEFYKGVRLIYDRLLGALEKAGLQPIITENASFDPHLHEAIDRMETDEVEPDTIVGEFQRGYQYRGKLLRPAMVKVAVRG